MEGIDRIKDHILTEADAEVEAIVKETRDVIEREILTAEEERRKILIEAAERADLDAALLIKRGESVADAEKRKQELAQKQNLADAAVRLALDKLVREPAEQRVLRYAGWIRRLGLAGGVITLSETDRMELGDKLLAQLAPAAFSIDPEAGDFLGGVLVTHDRIRDNLTYDLTVRDHRPELARIALEHLEEKSG